MLPFWWQLDSTCFAGSPTPSVNDIPLILALQLLRTSRRPLLESPCSEDITSVWSLPHTHPCQTTAFTCVFRCFPCDPSCGSASWAAPEFTPRSAAPMVKMTRSKTFQAYLPSCHRTYSCIHCRAHLANHDELISKVHIPCRPSLPTRGRALPAPKVAEVHKLSPSAQDICTLSSVQEGLILMAVSVN